MFDVGDIVDCADIGMHSGGDDMADSLNHDSFLWRYLDDDYM